MKKLILWVAFVKFEDLLLPFWFDSKFDTCDVDGKFAADFDRKNLGKNSEHPGGEDQKGNFYITSYNLQ